MWLRVAPGDEPLLQRVAAPISGVTRFNEEVFVIGGPSGFTEQDLRNIILHEMGHALGFGIVDCTGVLRYLVCLDFDFFDYVCPNAISAHEELVQNFPTDTDPPLRMEDAVNNTSCGHWADKNFKSTTTSDLMTAIYDERFQSLSIATIGAMNDIIYYDDVNYAAADAYPYVPPSNRLGDPSSRTSNPQANFDLLKMERVTPKALQRWGTAVNIADEKAKFDMSEGTSILNSFSG